MMRCPPICGRYMGKKEMDPEIRKRRQGKKKIQGDEVERIRWTADEKEDWGREEEMELDHRKVEAMVPQRFHRWLKVFGKVESERMFIDHQQEQWPEWLGTAEFAYNNKVHTGTKVSPFKANTGQDPRMGFELRKKGKFEEANKFMERMQEIQGKAKAVLVKAQEDMKKYADRHRGDAEKY